MGYLPILFFLNTFVIFNIIGVLVLLHGPAFLSYLYFFFSGITIPTLSPVEMKTLYIVLFGPIIFMTLGYYLFNKLIIKLPNLRFSELTFFLKKNKSINSGKLLIVLTLFSYLLTLVSLVRGEAFLNLGSWVNHDLWISSRWKLFQILSFLEFVNIYTIMPILTGLNIQNNIIKSNYLSSILFFLIGLFFTICLFQKKQIIIFLIIAIVPNIMFFYKNSFKKSLKITFYFILVCIISYSTAALLPTFIKRISQGPIQRNDIKSIDLIDQNKLNYRTSFNDFFNSSSLKETVYVLKGLPKVSQEIIFLVNSILFRTSVPTIFYVQTFPEKYNFLGVDLPFDGYSPNDNLIVWQVMWPNTPGGSVMTSFQFSFFAQKGVYFSMFSSFFVGILLSILWFFRKSVSNNHNSYWVVLVILFSFHLSVDSFRNSLLSSYGFIWGFLFIILLDIIRIKETNSN